MRGGHSTPVRSRGHAVRALHMPLFYNNGGVAVLQKQLIVVAAFIALDILTGLIKAFSTGNYRSIKMREGLVHKLTETVAIAFGFLADYALPVVGVSISFSIASAMVIYIVLMEAGSIIENIGSINPALGEKLSKLFTDANGKL